MPQENTILQTANLAWGFFGTIGQAADADTAWALAMMAIADTTKCPPAEVRTFLDSRHGRHFADDVANQIAAGKPLKEAVLATAHRWVAWTISRLTTCETNIPRGLPYLTGYVMHVTIEADCRD